MAQAYADDIRTIAAENPSAVILRGVSKSLALIPARRSRSEYLGNRITEKDAVRRALNAAKSDPSAMAGVRRILTDTAHGANAIRRGDSKIFDAVADAVACGQLYAVMADNASPGISAGQAAVNSMINYSGLAAHFVTLTNNKPDFFTYLGNELPNLWCKAYTLMPDGDGEIVQVNDGSYSFLFDLDSERVVAAFGVSSYNADKRDSDRMSGFLGKVDNVADLKKIASSAPSASVGQQQQVMAQLSWRERFFRNYGHKYDRGHFMSHRQGGGLDINLFPQRADVNQGYGLHGPAYRAMEKECAAHSVFCFSRPIYDDGTWVPTQLEYGLAYDPRRFPVRLFPNK